ncbi:helix-turn-helix transcriptional regulator [Oceanobacillus chungangensis]|uniref:DNA-binding protein n=1 Tax=Oceanobacillus chungangensis TaxID=1229152 RepID=A0A3D8PL10_9BACI|nr:helix-turn-helix domain-containing protein [Oceanobacillus chungangensis]RDW15939.1 hypothetical protein CWR45_15705 [Oceanobacillus chungangensis]
MGKLIKVTIDNKPSEEAIKNAIEYIAQIAMGEKNVIDKEAIKNNRNIRGVKALVEYLESIGTPIGETTIYKLLREKQIPHKRISNRVLIFNLDHIDDWINN